MLKPVAESSPDFFPSPNCQGISTNYVFLGSSVRIQARPMREDFDKLLRTPYLSIVCYRRNKTFTSRDWLLVTVSVFAWPIWHTSLRYGLYSFSLGPVSGKTNWILWEMS